MTADGVGVTATADDAFAALDHDTIVSQLFSVETANDPRGVYGQLREQCPVARTGNFVGEGSAWILSRYQDVMWALRHPETFSSAPEAVDIGQAHTLIP